MLPCETHGMSYRVIEIVAWELGGRSVDNMSKAERKLSESGAALMTVLVATLLLGTACIALLSAVGASSQNQTDALSEAKAYWAAESGLQATINVLRNTTGMTYNGALAQQAAGTFPVTGPNTVSPEASYSVQISNPDAALPYTYYTTGSFNTTTATGVQLDNAAVPPRICFPDCQITTVDRTVISYTGNTTGSPTSNNLLGTYAVNKFGLGADIPNGVTFRIEFEMTSPRQVSRTLRGKIPAATASGAVNLTFDSQVADLVGSEIELCSTSVPPTTTPVGDGLCPTVSFSLGALQGSGTFPLYAALGAVEPYRLKVVSTGYGPGSSQKKLEGVILRDVVNGLPSTSALTMVGPGANIVFQPGPGSPTYCGVDPGIDPGETIPNNPTCVPDPNSPSAPAIGVTDQTALDTVKGSLGNTQVVPAPDILTDGPEWLATAPNLNDYLYGLDGLIYKAKQSGKYIPDTNGSGVTDLDSFMPVGNFTDGSGLTFCEGSCTVGPRSGGGILVVTGNFEYSGNFNFRGTIIVVGNMHRNGAGSGVILGSVIIAPYDLSNPSTGFLSPRFTTTGGGTSDIIYNGATQAFDGTSAVSNLMIGVAEK
jgi:hypothetical protein